MPSSLTLLTLGGLEIRKDDQPLTSLASRKAEALLVYLAAEDRAHPREMLADLLWDDRSSAQALGNLRVLLNSLRKHLGEELETSRQSARLRRSPVWTMDSLDFETLLRAEQERGAGLTLLTESGAESLEAALRLYRGDFLQGVYLRESSRFEEWATLNRERLRLLAVTALENLLDYYKRCGDYPAGIRAAQRLLEFDPLREESHRELMLLLARNGQNALALRQYDLLRAMLEKEMGISPAPETEALRRKLSAAPVISRSGLPVYGAPFIGREAELERLAALLRRPECRLVSLLGPGGIGKTRLAAHLAAQMGAEFLNGVVFAALPPAADSDSFFLWLCRALERAPRPRQSPREALLQSLRERELLLVLDNFEQNLTHAALLNDLLVAAPGLKLLVISRVRLNLRDEWPFDLTGLAIPPENPQDSDAAQLFWQAARRVRPDFHLDSETLPHVLRICALVMGAPLGIELAAAWLRTLSPRQVAEAIADDLDTLSTTSPDVPERHRSFRALLDHSWQLLTEAERAAFCRLSACEGGFDYEAAKSIAGAGPVILSGLVEKSFVQRKDAGRYAIHELLRQYAAGRLEECLPRGEHPAETHARYYLEFAARREADLRGPRQPEALGELAAERENLRAALNWAISAGRGDLLAPALEALMSYLDLRGGYREAERLLARLTDLPDDGLFAAWVSAHRGWVADRLALYEQGRDFSERALAAFEQQGHLAGQAAALGNLGLNAISRGALEEASDFLTRGLDLARRAGDEACQARCLNLIGVIHKQRGDFVRAREILSQSLGIFRALGDPQRTASLDNNLGAVLRALGDLEAAHACYEENLSIRRRLGDPRGAALALVNLGNLLAQMEQPEQARRAYEESLSISAERDDPWGKSLCLHNLGDLARLGGEHALALRHYQESLALRRRIHDRSGAAYSLAGLGHACAALRDGDAARAYFREAAELALELKLMPVALDALGGMAVLFSENGEKEKAEALAGFVLSQPAAERQTRKLLAGFDGSSPHPPADLPSALALAFGGGDARQAA